MSKPETQQPSDEGLPKLPYIKAARYEDDQIALEAFQSVDAVRIQYGGLSTYRVKIGYEKAPYVIVLGNYPTEEAEKKLDEALSHGTLTEIPEKILDFLNKRAIVMQSAFPSIEAHYRNSGTDIKFEV